MPSAWIDLTRGTIRLESQRLEISGVTVDENDDPIDVQRSIPLFDLDRLAISETISLTGPALAALMRAEIPLVIIGHGGSGLIGSLQPASPAHAQWRIRQYQCSLNITHTLPLAQRLIAAKIYNQRRALQRLALSREVDVSPALRTLGDSINYAHRTTSTAALMGVEGQASALWYHTWAPFLPEDFPFEKRSRRPPHNPVNAVLSFTSAILYHEVTAALHASGLDPGLGILHNTENGRWSLALDLMEPFRPVIIEAMTLDLFSRGILQGKHFQPVEGGIYLNAHGKKRLILQYEKRLEREFLSEHRGHRTTLRAQIQQDIAHYKANLEREDAYQPFRMN
jgi:CRISP-associated protein Cas1